MTKEIFSMDAYALEILTPTAWRRESRIFWTQADAERTGKRLMTRRVARAVRVLPLSVGLQPVAEIPEPAAPPAGQAVAGLVRGAGIFGR